MVFYIVRSCYTKLSFAGAHTTQDNISLPVEVASGNFVLLVSLPNLYVGVLMWFCVFSHYKELEEQGRNIEVWCVLYLKPIKYCAQSYCPVHAD